MIEGIENQITETRETDEKREQQWQQNPGIRRRRVAMIIISPATMLGCIGHASSTSSRMCSSHGPSSSPCSPLQPSRELSTLQHGVNCFAMKFIVKNFISFLELFVNIVLFLSVVRSENASCV